MADPRTALSLLRDASRSGELAKVCSRHNVDLLVAFGSAITSAPGPRDLDLAVHFGTRPGAMLGLLDQLSGLACTSDLDLMDLAEAGPVARERALVGTVRLYEGNRGVLARMQMAAITERMDTEWLRRIDLELMAR